MRESKFNIGDIVRHKISKERWLVVDKEIPKNLIGDIEYAVSNGLIRKWFSEIELELNPQKSKETK